MPLRSFRTPAGDLCNVWEVTGAVPASPHERTRGRDRRGQDLLLYTGPERRRGERRKASASSPTSLLPPEYADGWLAFECKGEKRRLAPPPPGWDEFADAELIRLWHRARTITSSGACPLP